MKKTFLLLSLLVVAALAFGQTVFFSESFGTVSGTTAIANHNDFDEKGVTYSGTADIRVTSASEDYTGASGQANVFFTNTAGRYLLIEGIDSSSYSNISMSLGHLKNSNAANNELEIEVSSDGTNWTTLTYSRPTGTGTANKWIMVNPTGNIPSVTNLRIRFTQTSASPQFRIDDVKLTGSLVASNQPPIISDIAHDPSEDIFSTTTVSVSADVTDTDGTINLVQCKWGTETGDYPNTIDMSLDSDSTYITDYDIPAQSDGTTVYYVIYAEDDEDGTTTSFERSYNVKDPVPPPEGLIHYWNFNINAPPLNSTGWEDQIGADIGSGYLEYTFSNPINYAGITSNGIDDETAGGSFSPQGGTDTENNGKHFDLIVPTTEYENIKLSYATRGTPTGFKTQAIWYSTDGGTSFTLFETIDGRNVTSWSVQTIDFSSVVGANDNPNFVIRIVLDGATGATGNNRFDNIRIMGDDLGGGDPPVPVELSSFTATISAQNYITLTWVTQTETGMRGYYVFRAPANDLAAAQIVSPMIESMNSSQQQTYIYEDRELYDSGIYYYWLQANDLDGSSAFHGPVSVVYSATGDNPTPEIPLVTQLHSAYPNPFNPTVFIPFSLAEDGAVSFKIYNSRGQMVKHFDLGAKTAGHHRITWDGTDYDGKALANGVYQIMMSTKNQTYQSKATLLK